MIKVLVLALVAIMALGMALPVSANGSGVSSVTLDLIIDGRETAADVGDVTVTYYDDPDPSNSYFDIVYTITDPNWQLVETHVYLDVDAPRKSAPGKFPYTSGTIYLDVEQGDTVYIAAHAELQMIDPGTGDPILDPDTGEPIEETGWAQGNNTIPIPPGKNWATYEEWVPVPPL